MSDSTRILTRGSRKMLLGYISSASVLLLVTISFARTQAAVAPASSQYNDFAEYDKYVAGRLRKQPSADELPEQPEVTPEISAADQLRREAPEPQQTISQRAVINGNQATYVEPPADFKPIIYEFERPTASAYEKRQVADEEEQQQQHAQTSKEQQAASLGGSNTAAPHSLDGNQIVGQPATSMVMVAAPPLKPSVGRWNDWTDMSVEPDLASSDLELSAEEGDAGRPSRAPAATASRSSARSAVPALSPFRIRNRAGGDGQHQASGRSLVGLQAGDLEPAETGDSGRLQLVPAPSSGVKGVAGSGAVNLLSVRQINQVSVGVRRASQVSAPNTKGVQQAINTANAGATKNGIDNQDQRQPQQQRRPQQVDAQQAAADKQSARPQQASRRVKRRRKAKTNAEVKIQQLVAASQRRQRLEYSAPSSFAYAGHNQVNSLGAPQYVSMPVIPINGVMPLMRQQVDQQQQPAAFAYPHPQQQQYHYQQLHSPVLVTLGPDNHESRVPAKQAPGQPQVIMRRFGASANLHSANSTASQPTKKSIKKRQKRIKTQLPVGLTSWFLGGIRDLDGRHWQLPAEIVHKLTVNDVDLAHPVGFEPVKVEPPAAGSVAMISPVASVVPVPPPQRVPISQLIPRRRR